jgi:hypothetical protein
MVDTSNADGVDTDVVCSDPDETDSDRKGVSSKHSFAKMIR